MEEYSRVCPICGEKLNYTTKKILKAAINANRPCRKCSTKNEYILNPNKNKGESNGRYGKSLQYIWSEKYSNDEVNKRIASWKDKVSKNNIGENNSMYGKPAPKGSGSGWFGEYKGVFFRSSLELIFLIEKFKCGYSIKNAEGIKYTLKYIYNGKNKTYRPDFLIDNEIFEVKPISLLKDDLVKTKILLGKNEYPKIGYKFTIYTSNVTYYTGIKNYILPMLLDDELKLYNRTIEKIGKFLKRYSFNDDIISVLYKKNEDFNKF